MIVPDRILRKIELTDSCWLWKGARDGRNYGRVSVAGKNFHATRVIWELANGEIPEDMDVLHKCDNPPCVNPDHLFLGSAGDNLRDMYAKGRRSGKGIKNGNSRLSESDVINIRTSDIPAKNLAAFYQIHPATIFKIKKKKLWSHL